MRPPSLASEFTEDGSKLATYALDGSIMVWQCQSAGILDYLGITGKRLRDWKLPRLSNANPSASGRGGVNIIDSSSVSATPSGAESAPSSSNNNGGGAGAGANANAGSSTNTRFELPMDWLKKVQLQWTGGTGIGSAAQIAQNVIQLRRENGEIVMLHCSD